MPESTLQPVINVLLSELERWQADSVRPVINGNRDMAVIGQVATADAMETFVNEHDVDVVITGILGDEVEAPYQRVLFTIPSVTLIAITPVRDRMLIFNLNRNTVRDIGSAELPEVIRNSRTGTSRSRVPN
jgi:hypothetical protein